MSGTENICPDASGAFGGAKISTGEVKRNCKKAGRPGQQRRFGKNRPKCIFLSSDMAFLGGSELQKRRPGARGRDIIGL